MKVNEVFYSLQGEGARSGQPTVFVRLAGCNMTCGFCDTEFASGKEMTDGQLLELVVAAVERAAPGADACNVKDQAALLPWICWTGGEPTEQLKAETVKFFNDLGFQQSIETNGSNPVPEGIDWVCVSPKVAEHVLEANFPDGVDELRYVRHAGQTSVPKPAVTAQKHYLSPMFNGDRPDPANVAHCVRLCLENPGWSLSLQTHKIIKVL